jgi:diguanylate cyclase (GGDEF)-like protein
MIAASAVRSILTGRFGRKTFMQEIYIKSFMTTLVKSVPPFTPLSDVIETMKNSPHSCLVITDNEIPVGIITERDIVRLVGGLVSDCLSLGQPVREVMSQPVVTIDANTSLLDALVIAKSKHVRHLPVDNAEGKLVGLVTQSDLVTAQFRNHEMQARILERELTDCTRELAELRRSLSKLSREDPLLEIGNLRAMEGDIRHMNAISSRYHRPYSVALFGVDYFRSFNEHYGRLSADAALQIISSHFREAIRAADRLYRCGSDEFLVLLPETLNDGAQALAERLMNEIVACGVPHEQHPMKVLTVSAGVSSRDQWMTDVSWQDIVERASDALQQARKLGPNRVVSAQRDESFASDAVFVQGTIPRQ